MKTDCREIEVDFNLKLIRKNAINYPEQVIIIKICSKNLVFDLNKLPNNVHII